MTSDAIVTSPLLQSQSEKPLAGTASPDHLQQYDCFIGVSTHLAELKDFISVQATVSHPALLVGEPGLRQEQIARARHQASEHREEPFLAVNTRALNEDTIHELLFGARGMIERMPRGTIYINDLTGLSPLLQQRFAACIEEQRWRARSGRTDGPRLVFATTEDTAEYSAESRLAFGLLEQFRSSCFRLKPLRERSEDIPYLAIHLVSRIARHLGKEERGITPEAMDLLMVYEWERNIDELEAVLESAIASLPPPRIEVTLLPDRVRHAALRTIPSDGVDLFRLVDDYERSIIETALRQTFGNQTKAARLLGLKVQTLNMKLRRFAELNRPVAETVRLAVPQPGTAR